jgi:hypothetical protein
MDLESYSTCGGLHCNDGVELFDPPTSCNEGNIDSKDLPPIEEMMPKTPPSPHNQMHNLYSKRLPKKTSSKGPRTNLQVASELALLGIYTLPNQPYVIG